MQSCEGAGTVGCRLLNEYKGASEDARLKNQCSAIYNGMLSPLLPMRLGAMLWWQGESNADGAFGSMQASASNYACRVRAAVKEWRRVFEDERLPFFYIELAACSKGEACRVGWPALRQAQRAVLTLNDTGFVSAVDLGAEGAHSPLGSLHTDRHEMLGRRVASSLRRFVYGGLTDKQPRKQPPGPPTEQVAIAMNAVPASGPRLASHRLLVEAPKLLNGRTRAAAAAVQLHFRSASSLFLHRTAAGKEEEGRGCMEASSFELGYADGDWVRVQPAIDSGRGYALVVLPVDLVRAGQLTEVRYAWEGAPACVLYAGRGGGSNSTAARPAAPFRIALREDAEAEGLCGPSQVACPVEPSVALGQDSTQRAGATFAIQCCWTKPTAQLPFGEACVPNGGCLPAHTALLG